MKKGPDPKTQALDYSGGADRDRTDGLLNAIRNTAPVDPEIPNNFDYPDTESGD